LLILLFVFKRRFGLMKLRVALGKIRGALIENAGTAVVYMR
jgi:hypothetical protein